MKKFSIFLSLVSIVASQASIQVTWDMPNETDIVYLNDGVTELPANSVWQLIWSSTASTTDFNALNPFEPGGSDVLLQEHRNPNPGYIINVNVTNSSSSFVGGYVYTRVFDYQGSTSSFNLLDLDGMWYRTSTVITGPLQNIVGDPPGSPSIHEPFAGAVQLNQQYVIPEPGTIGLLVFGGLTAMVAYRRRRSAR